MLSLVVVGSLLFTSCKKDNSDSVVNEDILGSYDFVSLTASTKVTQTVSDGSSSAKTISTSNYTTEDNAGSLDITATQFISKDLGYSASTMGTVQVYEDGLHTDTYEVPFQAVVPPTNSTVPYKWITKDSIYFENSSIFYSGSPTPVATNASGAKVRLEGDKLYITASQVQTQEQSDGGITVKSEAAATMLATYKKK